MWRNRFFPTTSPGSHFAVTNLCVALALYRADMPSSITDCVRVYGYEARLVDFQKGTKEIEWPVD